MIPLQRVARLVLLFFCLSGMLAQVGCANRKSYGAVKFVTTPPGVEIVNLRDDTSLGISPITVTWESEEGKPEYVTVEMRKTGFREEITSFWVNTRHDSREKAQNEAHPITVELIKRK